MKSAWFAARRCCWVFAVLAWTPVALFSQLEPQTDLPEEFRSKWQPGVGAAVSEFYLNAPLGGFNDVILKARVSFNADEQAVWLETVYREPNVTDDVAGEAGWHSTSYIPTAVTCRSGVGRRFYVAGYIKRTGQVIVEEWKLHNLIPSKFAGPQPGGKTHLNLAYTIQKRLVFISDELHPIVDMACLAASNELMLLTGAGSSALIRVDIESGEGVAAVEAAAVSDLSKYSSLYFRVVNDGTPSGQYAAIYLRIQPRWMYAVNAHTSRGSRGEQIHYMQDDDFDGEFEVHSPMIMRTLVQDSEFRNHLTAYYDEDGVLLQ